MRVVAGVDIGGTNTKYGLVNESGSCIVSDSMLTKKFRTPSDLVRKVSAKILKMATGSELIGVGIGAPNGNYYKGTIDHPPNLPWKGSIPLTSLFEEQTGVPCILTNDANAGAIGEMLFGSAKNINDFIFITLGTGLGSGIVANRQLIYGHDGLAAELGHVIVVNNGRLCGCGRKGCLETYASASGIKRTIEEWIGKGKSTVLSQKKGAIEAADVFLAAKKGDLLAIKAFEFTGKILGQALANSVAYTSPKAIFLFGGLADANELLFEPTKKHFEKNLLNIYKNKIGIFPSGLKESNVAILGAASLAWSRDLSVKQPA
jgi:glucokinase